MQWLRVSAGMIAACIAVSCQAPRETTAHSATDAAFRQELLHDADSLEVALRALQTALVNANESEQECSLAFRRARTPYKRLEATVEFYAPALAAAFNSRRQEVDDEDAPPPLSLAPSGFPALETIIFDGGVRDADSLRTDLDIMSSNVGRVRSLLAAIVPTDAQRFELTRLELIRVATLGIAGFDTPASHDAMTENAEAVASLERLIPSAALHTPPGEQLSRAFRSEARYLRDHSEFESFDRLEFLAFQSEPALSALMQLRDLQHVSPLIMPRPLRANAASPFAENSFDVMAYAPRFSPRPLPELIALGEQLFAEVRLSGTGTRSCASCHVPTHGFTDGLDRAPAIANNHARIARHTPTLLNAALHPRQFADERAASLEDQVLAVLADKHEMSSSAELATRALSADIVYQRRFAVAFGTRDVRPVTLIRVQQALATYVRSLVSLNSRFDRAVRGDTAQLTAEERRGFNLFMGKARCGTCHFAPLFSGTTPPLFVNSDVEVIGTPSSNADFSRTDSDSGRARIDRLDLHYRAFRTPTVRNTALTAPYMHNGALRSLADVLRFYNGGGGAGAGSTIRNQTLAADALHLSDAEQQAVIAFLKSLTDSPQYVQHKQLR